MATFAIQFHATADELLALAKEWAAEHSLHFVATTYPPWAAREIRIEDLPQWMERRDFGTLVILENAPDLPAARQLEFLDKHPDALVLDIGRCEAGELLESTLSTMNATQTWRKIGRDLRRKTMTGATVVNERTGASARDDRHRFTEGAELLANKGVRMVQVKGSWVVFRFGENLLGCPPE